MIVKKPVLNVYRQPRENTEVHTQVFYGNDVKILESNHPWCFIQMTDGEKGWVKTGGLTEGGRLTCPTKSLFTHVYKTANTIPAPPLLTLPFRSCVKVLNEEKDRWRLVELAGQKKGWIQSGDLDLHPTPKTLEQIIPFALKFIGLPYTWGGTTSFGYDCSGFIQMLFKEMGFLIPRNSRDQISWKGFVPVDKNLLQPIDLLFFGEEKISHVAMYLGNGEFLHSGVRDGFAGIGISHLEKTHYTYAAARRLCVT